jgi:hypothetical protein
VFLKEHDITSAFRVYEWAAQSNSPSAGQYLISLLVDSVHRQEDLRGPSVAWALLSHPDSGASAFDEILPLLLHHPDPITRRLLAALLTHYDVDRTLNYLIDQVIDSACTPVLAERVFSAYETQCDSVFMAVNKSLRIPDRRTLQEIARGRRQELAVRLELVQDELIGVTIKWMMSETLLS